MQTKEDMKENKNYWRGAHEGFGGIALAWNCQWAGEGGSVWSSAEGKQRAAPEPCVSAGTYSAQYQLPQLFRQTEMGTISYEKWPQELSIPWL